MKVYEQLILNKEAGVKQLAILVDPDKQDAAALQSLAEQAGSLGIDYFFVGGSLLMKDNTRTTIQMLKKHAAHIPVVLFPGSPLQVDDSADALLFLSLISGRNAELLIGQHVIAAPYIKAAALETIPTGYILVDGGRPTTVSYISGTQAIPADKPDIAACTAMAGEMLGLKSIFLEAGSGAQRPVSTEMIEAVATAVNVPIIVGGGIRTAEKLHQNYAAGADLCVVGNVLEKEPLLLQEMADSVAHFRR